MKKTRNSKISKEMISELIPNLGPKELEQVADYACSLYKPKKKKPEKTSEQKEEDRLQRVFADRMEPTALGNCSSVSDWEERHGRGFWGCAAHGYTYDKDNR